MQTMKITTVAIVLGALMVSSAPARCNEIINGTRASIVNTVRDDIYRRVNDRGVTSRDLVNNPRIDTFRQ